MAQQIHVGKTGFSINAARATGYLHEEKKKLSPHFHYGKINTKWNKTIKALTIKAIIDKFYYIKMKSFYSRHNLKKQTRRYLQPIETKKKSE